MKKWSLILVFIIWAAVPQPGFAQGCALCTKTAADLSPKSARGLNGGILYLAFLPLAILCTVGFIWWRNGRPQVIK